MSKQEILALAAEVWELRHGDWEHRRKQVNYILRKYCAGAWTSEMASTALVDII